MENKIGRHRIQSFLFYFIYNNMTCPGHTAPQSGSGWVQVKFLHDFYILKFFEIHRKLTMKKIRKKG